MTLPCSGGEKTPPKHTLNDIKIYFKVIKINFNDKKKKNFENLFYNLMIPH